MPRGGERSRVTVGKQARSQGPRMRICCRALVWGLKSLQSAQTGNHNGELTWMGAKHSGDSASAAEHGQEKYGFCQQEEERRVAWEMPAVHLVGLEALPQTA